MSLSFRKQGTTDMGLDQYAYVAARKNQHQEYWNSGEWDPDTQQYTNTKIEKPREIAY